MRMVSDVGHLLFHKLWSAVSLGSSCEPQGKSTKASPSLSLSAYQLGTLP